MPRTRLFGMITTPLIKNGAIIADKIGSEEVTTDRIRKGAITPSLILPLTPGDYNEGGIIVNGTAPSASFVKVGEIRLNRAGSIRTRLGLKSSDGTAVEGRVYRNGVTEGTLRSTGGMSFTYWNQDISGWINDDLCQLYCRAVSGDAIVTASLCIGIAYPICSAIPI